MRSQLQITRRYTYYSEIKFQSITDGSPITLGLFHEVIKSHHVPPTHMEFELWLVTFGRDLRIVVIIWMDLYHVAGPAACQAFDQYAEWMCKQQTQSILC